MSITIEENRSYDTLQGAKNGLARLKKQDKGVKAKITRKTEVYRGTRKTTGYRVVFK